MNLKKIIILLILIIPNIVNADFFVDITNKIVDNTKRLSYGVSVADIDQNGKYEFIVTGFGYPNLALTYDNGKLINIANQNVFSDEFRKTIGVAACDVDKDGYEEIYFLNTDTYSGTKKYSDRLIDLDGNKFLDMFEIEKNKEKALFTINAIKNRSDKYQVNVVSTMLGRAKNHPNKTKDMGGAIKVFDDWLKKYKRKKNEK